MNRVFKILGISCIISLLIIMLINFYVVSSTKTQILKNDLEKIKDIDCVIILGAGILENSPSPTLQDRLDVGIKLYKYGVVKLI